MPTIDYDALAELFVPKTRRSRNAPISYKRFEHAAEALRYALEEVPPEQLSSTFMEVGDDRFDGKAIRALYDSEDYPLPRGTPKARKVVVDGQSDANWRR